MAGLFRSFPSQALSPCFAWHLIAEPNRRPRVDIGAATMAAAGSQRVDPLRAYCIVIPAIS
jgi:hypothetical protein